LSLPLGAGLDRPLRILALGAHCDDIEIGAGGTLLEWAASGVPLAVRWCVFTSTPERARETYASAGAFLRDVVSADVTVHGFRDGFLRYEGTEVKETFEALKAAPTPDLIFTHARGDLHQDHRTVSDLTWNTFRSHLILEYEIPKYDGDLGHPNAYVQISEENIRRKSEYLKAFYSSQGERQWFSTSTFEGLMRIRGIEVNSMSGYAEGFTVRKMHLSLTPPEHPGDDAADLAVGRPDSPSRDTMSFNRAP
jgi:LmbE family N-acetylglucosaminyl deacetylase